MSYSVKLSDVLIKEVRQHATVSSRSVPKQIEYWSRIGKIAEENPNLTYNMIKEILLSQEEVKAGNTSKYTFG